MNKYDEDFVKIDPTLVMVASTLSLPILDTVINALSGYKKIKEAPPSSTLLRKILLATVGALIGSGIRKSISSANMYALENKVLNELLDEALQPPTWKEPSGVA